MSPRSREESSGGHLPRSWVLFGRLLRRVGIDTTPAQIRGALEACALPGLERRDDVRAAAAAVLLGRRAQRPAFDRAFDAFWRAELASPASPRIELGRRLARGAHRQRRAIVADEARGEGERPRLEIEEPRLEARLTWSDREVLRHKDFAALDEDERRSLLALMRAPLLRLAPRRTRRRIPARRGPYLDPRRTLRAALRYGGEPLALAWRKRREKRRPLVVLCDVSGSMEPYARVFLQLLYAFSSATDRLEAFVFGTRLTRITRQLRDRDVDRALARATAAVVDWGGGTRIGAALHRFNYDWGRRVLGQGAVAVVISDGWDRGDVELLARETARLKRSCARLIWLNPLLGSPGYRPLTRGIRAVLPHVDDFLPLHDLASLEALAAHFARLD